LQLSKTFKTNAQLLQDSWTASANITGPSDNGFLHSLCNASSAELTASVVSWAASALKTCTTSNKMQANEKQLMHSSSNDVQFNSNELQPNSDDWQSTPFDFQLHGSALLAIAG